MATKTWRGYTSAHRDNLEVYRSETVTFEVDERPDRSEEWHEEQAREVLRSIPRRGERFADPIDGADVLLVEHVERVVPPG